MTKKYTARDYRRILTDVVTNGYYHIQAINNEIQAMKIADPKDASQSDQDKLRALTLTMTLINDLIHPAHEISRKIVDDKQDLINYCVNLQKIAFTNKLIDPCFCSVCKDEVEPAK